MLADHTHKKRPHPFGMQPFTIAEREGLCSLPLRIPSPLAAGALATGLKRLIRSKHIMAFFTRVLASELADTCKKTTAFLWNAAVYRCGEGGIRTPGAFQLNSFQDCRNRPLYHLSNIFKRFQGTCR